MVVVVVAGGGVVVVGVVVVGVHAKRFAVAPTRDEARRCMEGSHDARESARR